MKWKMYWVTIIAALGSIVLWKNYRNYKDKSTKFKITKSAIETGIVGASAAWLPGLLVVYTSAWSTKPLEKKPFIRMGAAAIISILLMLSGTYVLELLVIAGVFSIDLLSNDFLAYWEERKSKRANKTLAA